MYALFSANTPGFYFAFCVVVDGVQYRTGMGKTKKEARLNAAVLALEDLLPTLENQSSVLPGASGQSYMLIDEEFDYVYDSHDFL